MSINGDCEFCGGHNTDEEWDAWSGECQWCGEYDVEWEEKEDEDEDEDDEMDEWGEDEDGAASSITRFCYLNMTKRR